MTMLKNAPTFKIVEVEGISSKEEDDALYNVEIRVEDDAGGFKAIRTNKTILAFTSPVFKQQFFGSLRSRKNSGDSTQNKMEVVDIPDFTFNVVKDFIELITSSNVSIVDTSEDFGFLFEMLRISDLYQVLEVVDLVKGKIATVEITRADVVTAASISEMYKDLQNFEEVSEEVFGRCADVLHKTCPNTLDLSKFIWDNMDNEELIIRLLKKGLWNI